MASSGEPSPRRAQEARRRGEVAVSPVLVGAAGFVAALLTLGVTARAGWARLIGLGAHGFAGASDPLVLLDEAWQVAARLLLPPAIAALGASLLVGMLQARGILTLRPFIPGPDRSSVLPRSGREGLGRSLVFGVLTVAALVIALSHEAPVLRSLRGLALLEGVAQSLASVALRVGVVLLCAGLFDYGLRVISLRRALEPSRAEARRERRDDEGDPDLRAERRRRQGALH